MSQPTTSLCNSSESIHINPSNTPSVDTDVDNIAVFKLRGVTPEWTTYSCVINPAKPGPVVLFLAPGQ